MRPRQVGATRPQPQSACGKVCKGPWVEPALLPCSLLPHPRPVRPYPGGRRKDPGGPFLFSSHSSGLWEAASLHCCPEGDPGMSALRGGDSLAAVEPSSAPWPPGPPHCRASSTRGVLPCIQGSTCSGYRNPAQPTPRASPSKSSTEARGKGEQLLSHLPISCWLPTGRGWGAAWDWQVG